MGKVLGLTGPQSDILIRKNGTLVGDLFEKDVFQALKDKMDTDPKPKWITIFSGLTMHGNVQHMNEFDFLIIQGQSKKIIYVECKYTLTNDIAKKIKKQAENAFIYLQNHSPIKEGWEFVTLACYEEQDHSSICPKCQQNFTVSVSSLGTVLDKILEGQGNHNINNEATLREYEVLVKTYLFLALANKQTVEGGEVAKHQLKEVDLPGQKVLLWNLDQLEILHKDPKRMIIKSGGLFGTGKTEILKTKAMKLSKNSDNCIAFLIARPKLKSCFELLVTKQLRFQFKNHNNVRVEELKNQDEIAQLLSEMFPKFQNDPCRNVHLFIDEASKDHMNPIHTLLSNLPKDSANYIWIVDSDNFISHISEKFLSGFAIEKGLMKNLRNSQEIQETLPFVQENQKFDLDPEPDFERIISELHQERDAKQILAILRHHDHFVKIVKIFQEKQIKDIKIYGFSDTDDCSTEQLNHFLDAPNQTNQQFLLTSEDYVKGFEAEMVLFEEIHDIRDKCTFFRAKTKLRTAFLKRSAHPALQKKYLGVPKPKAKSSDLSILDFEKFAIEEYYYLESGPNLKRTVSYLKFFNNELDFERQSKNYRKNLERVSSIKQYNIKEESSRNTSYPFLFWLTIEDKWQTNYCIRLEGMEIPPKRLLSSLIKSRNYKVEIIELVINSRVQEWKKWINILMAEIVYCNQLDLALETTFNFRRLFSIWSRVYEEFKQQRSLLDDGELNDESFNQFRKMMIQDCFTKNFRFENIRTILESFAVEPKCFPNLSLVDTLLEQLRPDIYSHVIQDFIDLEFPHYKTESKITDDPKVANLRKELKDVLKDRYGSKKLNLPLILVIWEYEICHFWCENIEKNFPHVVAESWFQEIKSAENYCRKTKEDFLETTGASSIYLPSQHDVFKFIEVPFETRVTIRDAFTNGLVFLSSQPTSGNTKTC